MKRPQCNRVEADGSLSFCRVDGSSLVENSRGDAETIKLDSASLENDKHPPRTTDASKMTYMKCAYCLRFYVATKG